ncbi:ribonuclease P protein component [Salinibacterium sp. dk2585]|uniref:ribonuclease P protein component n=1 Tax=unclassified Salinibacterium TaxID=2632331 RepID=UPI0011C24D90|nr:MULTISPECIES: ribonuclease P protein component [unclassified Salinibacterium]QEE60118.1 ribonuclease P protein component [Salinibacterium sp. dk2585]TXK55190.1 ribonuclease P protein component [Salinibacterium sp. dk5596]
MLARAERLVSAADYRRTVRRGRRASSELMTVYVLMGSSGETSRFGFIVSKAVGNAVTRNRVRRRLKAICHTALSAEESNARVDAVIRAHPASATAGFQELESDVLRLLERSKALLASSTPLSGAR